MRGWTVCRFQVHVEVLRRENATYVNLELYRPCRQFPTFRYGRPARIVTGSVMLILSRPTMRWCALIASYGTPRKNAQ